MKHQTLSASRPFSRPMRLNPKAVQNHLMLDRKVTQMLVDGVNAYLPPENASFTMYVFEDDHVQFVVGADGSGATITVAYVLDELSKSIVSITAPKFVLERGSANRGHLVYAFILTPEKKLEHDRVPVYIGKTSQGLGKRFRQHMRSLEVGQSRVYRFARAECAMPTGCVILSSHDTAEEAFRAEEQEILKASKDDRSLVLNVMSSRGAADELFSKYAVVSGNEDDEEQLARRSMGAELNWQDPEYAKSVICNNPRNLGASDVFRIRLLTRMGETVRDISELMGLEPDRVRKVVQTKTYKRVLF